LGGCRPLQIRLTSISGLVSYKTILPIMMLHIADIMGANSIANIIMNNIITHCVKHKYLACPYHIPSIQTESGMREVSLLCQLATRKTPRRCLQLWVQFWCSSAGVW